MPSDPDVSNRAISLRGKNAWEESALTDKHQHRIFRQLGENESTTTKKNQWPADLDRRFRELWLRGVSIPQIAHALGKSEKAIKSRRCYVGLPPRKYKYGQRIRLCTSFSEDEMRSIRRRALERQQSPSAYLLYLVKRDM